MAAGDEPGSGGDAPVGPLPAPDRLYCVGKGPLARSFVEGEAVQALCGVWFVPVTDDGAQLAVCSRCEPIEPRAQNLLDMLRS